MGTSESGQANGASGLTSLLWPAGKASGRAIALHPETVSDLDLAPVIQALSGYQSQRETFVSGLLTALCTDSDVMAFRAEVIDNVLAEPELRRRLNHLLDSLGPLVRERRPPIFGVEWSVSEIVEQLRSLELYVEAAQNLAQALDSPLVRAPALLSLRASIRTLVEGPGFQALQLELPDIAAKLAEIRSVTIGVNLTPGLYPESATILSLDSERIEGRRGLLQRLLGRDGGRRGLAGLRADAGAGYRVFFPPMIGDGHGTENMLVRDLQRLLERAAEPAGAALEQYSRAHTRDFVNLESELAFVLHAAALVETLQAAGLPVCRPEIAPAEERVTCLEACYNISLALRMMGPHAGQPEAATCMVTSDVAFDGRARVWILTGPNRGGKTTYTRAIGLAHVLFQAGIYVPAASARLSPTDAILTHFPTTEGSTPGEGRLDEEAERLARIFRRATPRSVILLNEVLSGTSTLEALGLARDAVRGLHLLGVRAVYVTHLHDLARCADEINDTTPGDGVVGSLVAGVEQGEANTLDRHQRTFRIRPGRPLGTSYASEIAEQHGISYSQLRALLESRGVL